VITQHLMNRRATKKIGGPSATPGFTVCKEYTSSCMTVRPLLVVTDVLLLNLNTTRP
jgi:hypothetical protein